jgi:SAM-dependent methyltransferase
VPDLAATIDLFKLLGDPTRVRLLALLRASPLSVAELVRVTGLPQPRVSTHLRRLREAGLVAAGRNGSGGLYDTIDAAWTAPVLAAWRAVEAAGDPLLDADLQRLEAVLAEREAPATTWADSVAGRMSRHYSPGRTWQSLSRGLAGLCRLGRVLDIASGDGAVAELVAPRAASVTCLDLSERVVAAGRRRLSHLDNVRFVQGDMHDLPLDDASVDHVLLMAALCYAHAPRRVLAEAARVLAPGGDLVLVDLVEHAHERVVHAYDHVQTGFDPQVLRAWAEQSGLRVSLAGPIGRERRPPHFEILTLHAAQPAAPA